MYGEQSGEIVGGYWASTLNHHQQQKQQLQKLRQQQQFLEYN